VASRVTHDESCAARGGAARLERSRRPSKLDPFKEEIHRLLHDEAKLTGVRVRELIEPLGYGGGKSIVDDDLREVRPLFFEARTHQRTVYRPGRPLSRSRSAMGRVVARGAWSHAWATRAPARAR